MPGMWHATQRPSLDGRALVGELAIPPRRLVGPRVDTNRNYTFTLAITLAEIRGRVFFCWLYHYDVSTLYVSCRQSLSMEQRDLLSSGNIGTSNQPLPNATAALVLGIISLVGIFCYGIVGLTCGIIGLVLANKDRALYRAAPELYNPSSYSTSQAGRVCSIIGIVLSGVFLLFIIVYLIFVGTIISSLGLLR